MSENRLHYLATFSAISRADIGGLLARVIALDHDVDHWSNSVFRVALLMLAFVALDLCVRTFEGIPVAVYFTPSITLGVASEALARPWLLLGVCIVVGAFGWTYPAIWHNWQRLDNGTQLRWFVGFCCALLVWRFSTYDYNLYFDQSHMADRLLLIALGGLVVWRPVFLLPLAIVCVCIVAQNAVPISRYSWAQENLLIRLAVLFFAAFVVYAVTGRQRTKEVVFLTCCLVAAHYWIPGLGKWQIEWWRYGHIHHLMANTYANGWLANLSSVEVSRLASALAPLDRLIVGCTLILEIGALVVMWRRRLLQTFLVGFVLFHFGVLGMSGIFFWQWILVDIALLFLLRQMTSTQAATLHSLPYFLMSVILIGGARYWVTPTKLSWHDSNIGYTYRFEAIDDEGQRFHLPPRFFEPYDFQFSLGSFSYLLDRPVLSVVWGATKSKMLDRSMTARDLADVRELELEIGRNNYDPQKAAVLDEFLNRFIHNMNDRGSKATWLSLINAPPQIWTFARGREYSGGSPITRVEIFHVTSLFTAGEYRELNKEKIRDIDVPNEL